MTLLELDITGFAHGGAGVARHGDSGRVVFVDGALPGERVAARLDGRSADGDRFWRATATEIIEAAPQRIPVSCPAAAAGAGCCDLAYVDAAFARDLKRGVLEDLLGRIGRLDATDIAGLLGPLAPLDEARSGWRVRTRLAVGADGRAGLRAAGSAEVITVPCSAPVPGLVDGLVGGGLDALDLRSGTELVVAVGADGERGVVELIPADKGGARDPRGGRRAAQRRRGAREAARTGRTLEGDGFVTEQVGPWRWQLPVTAFWQAHRAAPAVYSRTAVELLAGSRAAWVPAGPVTAWDLFGGAGVFAGALLAGAADLDITVGGIEIADSDAAALTAAEQTFADAPVTVRAGRIGPGTTGLAAPDVVIVDPPRAGAKAPVVDLIAAAGPAAVVHVGCDPAAFARDLARYGEHGYRPSELRAFDAFPNTHHVEVMALLLRP